MVIKDFKCNHCNLIFEEIVDGDISVLPCDCGENATQVYNYGFYDGGERDQEYYRESSAEGLSIGIGLGEKHGRAPRTEDGKEIKSEHTKDRFKEFCEKKDVSRNGVTPMTV